MKVSIIIPSYNRKDLLKDCLEAIRKTVGTDVEVIVIDSYAGQLSFSKACNKGAMQAKGKYLVFLNDDTIPEEGWLDELLLTMDNAPDIGIVGAKLLLPKDRTIQHAGVSISGNKTPYHLYRGCHEDFLAANRQRDYQAITGACLLISKQLFEQVYGFDERFINGMEDIDLCMKVKELGKRIVYNPKSVVLHYEGQSDYMEGYTGFNTRLFRQIWNTKIIPDDVYWLRKDNLTVTGWDGNGINMIYKDFVCR